MAQIEDSIEEWLRTVRGGICYTEKLKFYAPTCYGKCLDAVQKLATKINNVFGGSTIYDAKGCWINPRGELECEPVKVIEAAHHCTNPEAAEKIAQALVDYAGEAKQEYLAVEEGSFFVAPSEEMAKAYENLKEKMPTL